MVGGTWKRWGCFCLLWRWGRGLLPALSIREPKMTKALGHSEKSLRRKNRPVQNASQCPTSQERKTLSDCSCLLAGLCTSRLSPPPPRAPTMHSTYHKRCKTANLVFGGNLLIIPNSCSEIFNVSSLHIRSDKSTLTSSGLDNIT